LVHPNSTIEAAISSTCVALCVRGLRSYGRKWSIGPQLDAVGERDQPGALRGVGQLRP
jgi:hypothetical protein